VPTHAKPTTGETINFLDAPTEFKDPGASFTEKMVMMRLA
jgi:hypothetical protein